MQNTMKFNAPHNYYQLWKSSVEDPVAFWGRMAEDSIADISWDRKWDEVFEREYPHFKWFAGGTTNAGYNCVDYKQSRYRNKAAYIQEAPELGISRSISYADLYDVVVKYSAALRNSGVGKGDRVLFYIPNCIEAAAMLQACARIGAISTCVFAGFSPGALADRIELTRPKVIFTQDFTVRRGKEIRLKESVSESLSLCSRETIEALKLIIINPAEGKECQLKSSSEILLAEFEEKYKDGNGESVFLEANEPLLIMCTSGTTAKPKPVVHVHGGFQIWTYWTAKWVYNIKPDDVIFNTSDIGWIVGQSYMVFAPLLAGSSVILYEGTPDFPRSDMWWDIMEKHQATMFWTSPTGARVLRGLGIEQVEKHDLTSLERVVVAGEVLNPQVWAWLHDDVFKKKISIFDHMWQTEVPGSMFGYSYGVQMPQVRPGSAGFPLPGVIPEIVDDRTGEQCSPNEKGVLLLREPVPGMTPTLWEDPERYRREYWDAKPYSKGKYFTGDSAYFDNDGYIWFCGRADEVIKIAGHRIGPAEIESVLISHSAVKEAAVYGVPDELRGQMAAAFIVLNPDMQPSDELKSELKDHVRKVMGPIVVFKYVEFINVIPKTRSGKILRRIMSKMLQGEDLGDLSTIDEDASIDEIKEAISKFSPYVK